MYWEPGNECMHREELEQLQLERLQATLNRVYGRVPFYQKKFDDLGITPEDITSLIDLARDDQTEDVTPDEAAVASVPEGRSTRRALLLIGGPAG